jgi:hypothetical protein
MVGMPPAITRLFLCVGFLLALSVDAGAQQVACFTVVMTNATAVGSLGSILLDKCTGNSWILVRTTLDNGTTTARWFPITVEKSESTVSAPAPTAR